MRHGAARSLMADLALGLLDPADVEEFERHAAKCSSCLQEADAFAYAVAGLAAVAAIDPALVHVAQPVPPIPPGMLARLGDAIGEVLGIDGAHAVPVDDPEAPPAPGPGAAWPNWPVAPAGAVPPPARQWGFTGDDERTARDLAALDEPIDDDPVAETVARPDAAYELTDDSAAPGPFAAPEAEPVAAWPWDPRSALSSAPGAGLDDDLLAGFDDDEPLDAWAELAAQGPTRRPGPPRLQDLPAGSLPEDDAVALDIDRLVEAYDSRSEVAYPAFEEAAGRADDDAAGFDGSGRPAGMPSDLAATLEIPPDRAGGRRFRLFGRRGADEPVEPDQAGAAESDGYRPPVSWDEVVATTAAEPVTEVESAPPVPPPEGAADASLAIVNGELTGDHDRVAGNEEQAPAAESAADEPPEGEDAFSPVDAAPGAPTGEARPASGFGEPFAAPLPEAAPPAVDPALLPVVVPPGNGFADAGIGVRASSAPSPPSRWLARLRRRPVEPPPSPPRVFDDAAPPPDPWAELLGPAHADAETTTGEAPGPSRPLPTVQSVLETPAAAVAPDEALATDAATEAEQRPATRWTSRFRRPVQGEPVTVYGATALPRSDVFGDPVAPPPGEDEEEITDEWSALLGMPPVRWEDIELQRTAPRTVSSAAVETVAVDPAAAVILPAGRSADDSRPFADTAIATPSRRERGGLVRGFRNRGRHSPNVEVLPEDDPDQFAEALRTLATPQRRRGTFDRVIRPGSRGYLDYEEDPRALVSFDEEIRRMARPVSAGLGRPAFSPAYIPGPVEWGLERYDDADDDEDFDTAIEAIPGGSVDSSWRFWAITLAVFSALLFGIMVFGYFYLRDLQGATNELETVAEASAIPIQFVPVTREEGFNTRGDGYFERAARRALLRFGGLPPVERADRYVVWAVDGSGAITNVGLGSSTAGSTQFIEARNIPEDATRLFVTIETPQDQSFPTQPEGVTLLEVTLPD